MKIRNRLHNKVNKWIHEKLYFTDNVKLKKTKVRFNDQMKLKFQLCVWIQ